MKTKTKTTCTLFLVLLFTICLPVFSKTIEATYTMESPLVFTDGTWANSKTTKIMKLSTLTISALQANQIGGSDVKVALNMASTSNVITLYNNAYPDKEYGAFLGCIVYVGGAEVNRLNLNNESGVYGNILGSNPLTLKGKDLVVEFYVVPWGNCINEDSLYTLDLSILSNLNLDFWTAGKNENTWGQVNNHDGNAILINGRPVGDLQPVVDGNPIIVVPGDKDTPIPSTATPVLNIVATESPNLNASSFVKVADLYGYWNDPDAVDNASVILTITPSNYALIHSKDPNQTIDYTLKLGNDTITSTNNSFEKQLTTSNTSEMSQADFGDLTVILEDVSHKAAGFYSDTIRITISLDE